MPSQMQPSAVSEKTISVRDAILHPGTKTIKPEGATDLFLFYNVRVIFVK